MYAKCKLVCTKIIFRIRLGDIFEDIKDVLVIQRSEYEEWPECKRMVENAMAKVRKLLGDSKLKPTDINDVLLVGGSTRLPMIEVLPLS